MKLLTPTIIVLFCSMITLCGFGQPTPSDDEKIPYLCTFGKSADKTWGDDDFVQIFFFVIPKNTTKPIYIKVYDPDVGGNIDENRNGFNTHTKFSIFGGRGAHSDKDSKQKEASGNYKAGVQLASKTFDASPQYDEKWYSFGPFNPTEGEYQPDMGGYVFKMVVEGISGDDGNLYRLFLSSSKSSNIPVEGGNSFTYEYSFRLHDRVGSVSHIYPFIGKNVVSVKVHIFDYDDEGIIRTVSVAKKGNLTASTTEGVWSSTKMDVSEEEHDTSMDIQFIKQKPVKNNNVVVYITNQYDELLPFYTTPIGGVPKYKYEIKATKL